jgi:hypothetical protein
MIIDYERWHDGGSYDLEAIRAASPEERRVIELLLLDRGTNDWRDVEALAELDTAGARAALRQAGYSREHDVAMAVAHYAPDLLTEDERTAAIVRALRGAQFYEGLSESLELAEAHHPPAVLEALLRGTIERTGDVAVHFAALVLFLHGKADSSFDMAQRPFILTFNTPDRDERAQAFRELCTKAALDPEPYLRGKAPSEKERGLRTPSRDRRGMRPPSE